MRSDAAFNKTFEQGLQRAVRRFVDEYKLEDEDLVAAIATDKEFFQHEQIQQGLLAILKRPGAYLVEEQETLQDSFSSVLPQRLSRKRVDRAVIYLLKCLAEELWHLPELQPVYSLQFQRVTAEAAREQVALARRQLEATAQLGAGVREALLQLTSAMENNLLAAPAAPALPSPRPYHNLPQPDYARFIGREHELAWLRQRLSPRDRAWQIALTGIGGVGKSALALTIAHEYRERYHQLPAEERFEAIIWVSAKEEVLTAYGREQAALPELVLRTLEDVYTAIARTLDREDITRAVPEEQGHLVEKALQEQRTLLIMDNLESVKDERIKPFLRALPAPTKAIITSREWLDVADVMALKGLSLEEANALLDEEAAVRQVNLEAGQRHRLFDLTAGLPLPIKLSVARLASGESFAAVTRWLGDATGDLPEYCIAGQAELAQQRNPDAWCLLLACSLFDRGAGASREALGYVVDLSLADRDSGLAQLQRLFLVNRTESDRFWVLPIVQRYASVQFSRVDFGEQLIQRWLDWLANFAQTNGIDLEWQLELLKEIKSEYSNLLNAIRWCQEQKRWNSLLKLAEGTWGYPYLVGLFHEFNEILTATLLAAKATDNERMKGRVELQIARLAVILRGQSEDLILDQLTRAEEIALRYGNNNDLGEVWSTRIDMLAYLGRLEEALQVAHDMLARGEEKNNLRLKWLAGNRLAYREADRGNFEQAFFWLGQAEKWTTEPESSRCLAILFHARGVILLQQENFEAAEPLLLQSLEMTSEWEGRRYIADIKLRLAQVYIHTSRLQLARQSAEEARDLFQRLGMKGHVEEVTKLLEQLMH